MQVTSNLNRKKEAWMRWIVIVVLFVLVMFALEKGKPTSPAALNVASNEFSAHRAMPHLLEIAREPHPTGTAENAKVRAYLVAQLRALGLEPQLQTTHAIAKTRRGFSIALINNVLVRKAGTDTRAQAGKAILLTAHYDSVPHGPGAADDGASVASILETLRALNSAPALQNDLICLFSDGEEVGLLGAEAFVSEHPWAKDVGLSLNFEYRGNSGPMLMFETSPGNGQLIEGMAQAVAHPVANSLNYEIYKRLPNDTDFSVFKRAGIPGLNFAAIEGHPSYHTPLDRPELMDKASLQHQGDIMLSLVRHFGNRNLNALQATDQVYFDFPGLGLLHYSTSAVMPLSVALFVLFIGVSVLAVRRKQVRAGRLISAALGLLLMIALFGAAAKGLWEALLFVHPNYQLMLQGEPYNSHWYLLAFVALTVGSFVWLQKYLRRWISSVEFVLGTSLIWSLLLLGSSVYMPGASFLLMWPLLLLLLVQGALFFSPDVEGNRRTLWLLFAASPAVLLFTPLLRAVFIGLGPNMVFVMVSVLVLLLGLMAGLLAVMTRGIALISIAGGAIFLLVGALTSGFDVNHPQPDNLFYIQDAQSAQALWVSEDVSLNAWNRQFFAGVKQRQPLLALFGNNASLFWSSPAPEMGVSVPAMTVLSDLRQPTLRQVVLEIKSLRSAPSFVVIVEGAKVRQSTVNKHILGAAPREPWSLFASGIQSEGILLALEMEPGKAFRVWVRERSFGLPKNDFAPRPPEIMVQPFGSSNSTQSVRVLEFSQ